MSRGRKTALTIDLTADERVTLTQWQRSTTIRAGDAKRGRILLLLAEGLSVVQVATMVGITRRFVYKWAQRFQQHGVEGLADKSGRGRRLGLTMPARGK
jgi:CRP-like cAMP-binding protein